MRMLRKQTDTSGTGRTVAIDGGPPSVAERPWYGPTRATATLIGIAVAGFLIWLATQISDKTTGGYWAEYGIVAGAGLVLALSQLLGGWTKFGIPRLSASVLLLAFIPALIAVGWITIFNQPHGNWFRSHVVSWSGDIGIDAFIRDMQEMLPVLTLGLGVVFGFSFDTTGPRRLRGKADVQRTRPAPAPVDRKATDEPLTAERGTAVSDRKTVTTTSERTTPEE
jgi:hypothetical protein